MKKTLILICLTLFNFGNVAAVTLYDALNQTYQNNIQLNAERENLKAKNFSLLQKWRLKQEHKLWLKTKKSSSHKLMSKGDVINFMQTYQRITENMFKKMPKYASIVLNLNSNHQIKSAVYKVK